MTTNIELKIQVASPTELRSAVLGMAAQFGGPEVVHPQAKVAADSSATPPAEPEIIPPTPATMAAIKRGGRKKNTPAPEQLDIEGEKPGHITVEELQAENAAAEAEGAEGDIDPAALFGGDDAEAKTEADPDAPLDDDEKVLCREALMKVINHGGDDAGRGVLIGEFKREKISHLTKGDLANSSAGNGGFIARCAAKVEELKEAKKAARKKEK